jgi:20S proteasome alpha/beta subunit
MTPVIAIACTDGAVIAADSASTDPEIGIKQLYSSKIKRIGDHPILYGGSGDVGLLQKIGENLEAKLKPQSTLNRIRREIKRLVCEEISKSSQLHAPQLNHPIYRNPPEVVMLFAGIWADGPWILEIERDGRDTMFDEDFGGFAAIGAGKPWAQAIFRPHLTSERDLELGKVFAYRVVEDSISRFICSHSHWTVLLARLTETNATVLHILVKLGGSLSEKPLASFSLRKKKRKSR